MILMFLLWLNLLICPIIGIFLLLRRTYPVATSLIVCFLFFISGISYFEILTFNYQDQILIFQKYTLIFEACATICSYFYTKTIFRNISEIYKGIGFWLAIVCSVILLGFTIVIPSENIYFSPNYAEEHILFLTKQGFFVYLVFMVYLVFGLVQLERTFSGLHQLQRWGIKLEVIGSGLLLAAFAFYFSQDLLYRSLNTNYLGLRSVVVLLGLGLLVYSRLTRGGSSKLALSRGIAHRSFVLLIVGGYLVLLGIIGEGLRYLNVADVQLVFFILLFLGGFGLAVVFLSEKLRRKLKVILHKNFFQSKYDYREQWEMFATRVSTSATLSEIQSAILDLFCEILACKGAGFYLREPESNTYLLATTFNFRRDWRPFPAIDQMIRKLQRRDWIVNLTENNPELEGSLVESFTDVKASLVIPLHFDEELEGFIVLGEQINTGEELTYEDYDLLRMLARQTISIIQGLRLSDQLTAARELAAIGRVSTFVLHDLKNQVSGLSLMLDNAGEYIDNPQFQEDMLETVSNTVDNMKGLIARLKNLKEKPQLILAPVDLKQVIEDAVETSGGEIEMSGETARIFADEEEIYKVILNLLLNAKEASNAEIPVRIDYGQRGKQAFIHVTDKGCGMDADFIQNRLFKPFETTKKYGFGIGLYQCKQIIESHQGNISVTSKEGDGTRFSVFLPLAPEI